MSHVRPASDEHDSRKAKISEPNRDCVRRARQDGWVETRDDKRDDKTAFGGPAEELDHAFRQINIELESTDTEVAAFLAGVRAGEFDLAACVRQALCRRGRRETRIEHAYPEVITSAALMLIQSRTLSPRAVPRRRVVARRARVGRYRCG
jgi:hypothetical protein